MLDNINKEKKKKKTWVFIHNIYVKMRLIRNYKQSLK